MSPIPLNIDYTKLDIHEQTDVHVRKVLKCLAAFGNEAMKYEEYQPFYEEKFPQKETSKKPSQFKDAISHWKDIIVKHNLGFAHQEGEDTMCIVPKGELHRVCKLSANKYNGTGYKGTTGHGRAVLAYIDTRFLDIFNRSGQDTFPTETKSKPKKSNCGKITKRAGKKSSKMIDDAKISKISQVINDLSMNNVSMNNVPIINDYSNDMISQVPSIADHLTCSIEKEKVEDEQFQPYSSLNDSQEYPLFGDQNFGGFPEMPEMTFDANYIQLEEFAPIMSAVDEMNNYQNTIAVPTDGNLSQYLLDQTVPLAQMTPEQVMLFDELPVEQQQFTPEQVDALLGGITTDDMLTPEQVAMFFGETTNDNMDNTMNDNNIDVNNYSIEDFNNLMNMNFDVDFTNDTPLTETEMFLKIQDLESQQQFLAQQQFVSHPQYNLNSNLYDDRITC